MKKRINLILVVALLLFTLPHLATFAATNDQKSINEKLGVPIVVFGGSLSPAEKDYVETALQIKDEPEFDEIIITGADLAKYIQNGNASARMYSSAKITRQEEGKGLMISVVTPNNITEVTAEMYATAMLTAGIEDAIVEIAAPKPVTGHSALVGIYKAYEVTTGETLNTERTDVANEELNLATDLVSKSGLTDEAAAQLLTEIKKVIAEKNPASIEEVEQIVKEQLAKLNISLSEQDLEKLVQLMNRISKLNIDFDHLSQQLSNLGSSLTDKVSSLIEEEGFFTKIINFFKSIFNAIASLF